MGQEERIAHWVWGGGGEKKTDAKRKNGKVRKRMSPCATFRKRGSRLSSSRCERLGKNKSSVKEGGDMNDERGGDCSGT